MENSAESSVTDVVLSYFMLVLPFFFAVACLVLIQNMDETIQPPQATQALSHAEGSAAILSDRVSIMVILEVFALTLIIRPWEFPWSPLRFLFAEFVFFVWGSLVIPMSMHMGRLMASHALVMMGLIGFVLPVCMVALGIRTFMDYAGNTAETRS